MQHTLLSTAYFPNFHYCKALCQSEKATIDIGEHYVKQSFRSRCEILGPNGLLKLIVPLKKWNNNIDTKDIQISNEDNWKKSHWKSLESAYRSSPYFEYYEDKIEKLIFDNNHDYLVDFNQKILVFILEVLELDLEMDISKQYIEDTELIDLRNEKIKENEVASITQPYIQVFSDRHDFVPNLSILDLICNEGPNAINLLT